MSNLFGWELLRKSASADFSKDADQIVAFVHWFLIQKAHFGCLGNGNDLKLLESDVCSELLPADWNVSPKTYALRYQDNDKVYVLLGTISAETIVFNLLSANKMELSNVQFPTASTLTAIQATGNARQPSADVQAILGRLTAELLQPVFESNTATAETQTTAPAAASAENNADRHPYRHDPLADRRRNDPLAGRRDDYGGIDPLGVGRGDLDPFGRGGGMLFQPPMRPGVPGGLFGGPPDGGLPGARFDPFPQGPIGPRRPDGDHFQPPGWYQ